jgi:hypothetical protein
MNIACILLSVTNKMQYYTILFITVNALRVTGGFSAHHQELKNRKHRIWYVPRLLTATASVVGLEPWNSTTLAPDDGRRNCPTHIEH